jgi:cytochrome c553
MTSADSTRRPALVPLPVGAALVVILAYVALILIQPVIPQSVILLYMGFITLGVVIHVTLDDERIARFWDFFLTRSGEGIWIKAQRLVLLAVLPLAAGWWTYAAMLPRYSPPVEIFQRHPTVGEETLSKIVVPDWVQNPAAWREADIARGKAIYTANCAVCHGDKLDGNGPAALGFRYPIRPANFRDAGTIGQLTLPYVYWRLTVGGIQNQFNSAMPRWVAPTDTPNASSLHSHDFSSDEAWQVILYLYRESGFEPRKQ